MNIEVFCLKLTAKKVQQPTALVIKKIITFVADSKYIMSSVILNIKEEYLSKCCLCNTLTYNVITPPSWLKPSVDNGQQTTDNSLRVLILLLKKNNIKSNFHKFYLTKIHKVCTHALRYCIALIQFI